jgi:hypothetical protein
MADQEKKLTDEFKKAKISDLAFDEGRIERME